MIWPDAVVEVCAMSSDLRVIACNYKESISAVRKGALCYMLNSNPGNGGERVNLLIRSRSGRWIEKWENVKRLGQFRMKTVPPEHPQYERLKFSASEKDLGMFNK